MKIGSFHGKVDLASVFQSFPKGNQAIGELTKAFIEFAYKESMNRLPVKSFNFLLTTRLEGDVFHFGLVCHVEPFYSSYKELLSLFFSDQKAWQERVSGLPKVADLRCNLGFGDSVPHQVAHTEQNIIDICCIQQPLYKVEFPINTSTLLCLISAVIRGEWINLDNINIGKREPKEMALMNLLLDVQEGKGSFKLDDFEIDTLNPENWRLR